MQPSHTRLQNSATLHYRILSCPELICRLDNNLLEVILEFKERYTVSNSWSQTCSLSHVLGVMNKK
jgi:hypothetical protein